MQTPENELGELVIRTVPQPSDININGNIFGGWVLSQMDIAGGSIAARVAKGPVATVAIEGMKFISPIEVGDNVSVYVGDVKTGRTSIALGIRVYAAGFFGGGTRMVTSGRFVFVAVDSDGTPRVLEETEA